MNKRNFKLEELIINDYENGINNKELCEKYSKHRSTIQQILKRNNVFLRNGSDVSKKYEINENFFEKIDTQDKAYVLGLIYADGTISKKFVRINLVESDSHILDDIAKKIFIGNYKISTIKSQTKLWENGKFYISKPQKALIISRKKIVDDLKSLGACERKSFTIKFPNILDDFISHFIRGFFDGDGCFYTSEKYINNNRVDIISNHSFLLELKHIIETNINITVIVKQINNTEMGRLHIYGNRKSKIFLDWIYQDSELKINRKYKHYLELE